MGMSFHKDDGTTQGDMLKSIPIAGVAGLLKKLIGTTVFFAATNDQSEPTSANPA
jgi:hypothetical protein